MAIDREKLLRTAGKLVDKKKYDKAILEYRKIVQQDPGDARTLLKIGDIQSRMQDYAAAVATYNKVATHYASQGFQLKAIAVFKQVRELIRKHAPQLSAQYSHVTPRLADIYAELNLVSDALTAYDEVATMYQKTGRDRDAIVVFEKTVFLDPKNPLPHLRLAEARCRIKQFDEATLSFWTAAELLLGLKRPDDALRVIERILHFKQDPLYARAAAELYLKKGDPQAGMQALSRLQIAFQANPKDLDTLALLAQAFEVINQKDKALEVHLEMGRLAKAQGKDELLGQIVAHLQYVAPQNPQVIALAKAGSSPAENLPPPRPAKDDVDVEETEAVSLDADFEYIDEPAEKASTESPPAAGGDTAELCAEVNAPRQQQASSGSLPLSRPPSVTGHSIRPSQPEELLDFDEDEDDQGAGLDELEQSKVGAPSSFQPSSQAHKALANARTYREMGLVDKAVETLHRALEVDPNAIPVRESLREILVEADERDGAIRESLNIAIIHVHNQNPDDAEPLAREVLSIDPQNADAANILNHVAVLRESIASMSREGHLASYDMEGVRPGEAINDIPEDARVPDFDEGAAEVFQDEGAPFSSPHVNLRDTDPVRSSMSPASLRATGTRPTPEAIEEVLEEAEFFATQGLYSDAEAILSDMLESAPDHVLLREQLDEVKATLGKGSDDEAPPDSLNLNDNSFDIAASLDALDDIGEPSARPALHAPGTEVDVDQVFAKFKEGVKTLVKDNDAATHYDLGLAYKEMGLLNDACGEFELASNDPSHACMCFAMIGIIQRDEGRGEDALDSFLKALATKEKTPDQEKGIEYDLALLMEAKGKQPEYLKYLKSIAQKDSGYRDVSARIRALGESMPPSKNEDQEFDAAFDNLF